MAMQDSLIIFNCAMVRRRSSSSSVVVVRHTQKILPIVPLLQARARARQMASGGFAISISGTRNRSEITESRVLKTCMCWTIDFPGIHTNHPAC